MPDRVWSVRRARAFSVPCGKSTRRDVDASRAHRACLTAGATKELLAFVQLLPRPSSTNPPLPHPPTLPTNHTSTSTVRHTPHSPLLHVSCCLAWQLLPFCPSSTSTSTTSMSEVSLRCARGLLPLRAASLTHCTLHARRKHQRLSDQVQGSRTAPQEQHKHRQGARQ